MMDRRRSISFLLLWHHHLSIIGSAFFIHVAQGFVVSRQQQQQHDAWCLVPDITARRTRRQRQPVLGAFSSDNDSKRNGQQRRRRHRDDDDDDDNSSDGLSLSSSYLATCIPGISSALARELTDLGCQQVQITGPSAVRFIANPSTALSTLLWARTPHKIMQLLFAQQQQQGDEHDDEHVATIYNRDDLHNCIRQHVNVKDLLGDGRGGLLSLSVSVIFNNADNIPSDINHSHFTALTIKNALCDAVRDLRQGRERAGGGGGMDDRPNVDLEDPDVPLVAVLRGTTTTSSSRNQDGSMNRGVGGSGGAQLSLYRQLHNGSLHRRGYRQEGKAIHKAAMKESLAAGLLLESEWDKICKDFKQQQQQQQEKQHRLVLVDPMAGSGTLLLEGAIMAADLAPHLMRIKCGLTPGGKSQTYPPVVRWKHIDDGGDNKMNVMEEWKRLLQEATVRAKKGLAWLKTETSSSNVELIANDCHPGSLDLLESALHQAGLNDGIVKVSQLDCRDFQPFSALASSRSSDTHNDIDQNDQTQSDVKVLVVTNPPWGVRLGGGTKDKNDNEISNDDEDYAEDETLHDSWEALRVFLRDTCPPGKTEAWVLSGNKKSTKHLGLRRSKSIPIKVGQHDLRWIQYEIHDQKTKMAIMANKQQQQQSQREKKETQRSSRPIAAYSKNNSEMSHSTRSTKQPWKQEEDIAVDRSQKTATISTTRPQSLSSSQPKRQVVQSRQKAVSDENEWLLD